MARNLIQKKLQEQKQNKSLMVESEKKYTIKELYDLYVVQNYSMDMVSYITNLPLAQLSRVFQKYHLPERKLEYYGGNIVGEKNKLKKPDASDLNMSFESKSAEELFFDGM